MLKDALGQIELFQGVNLPVERQLRKPLDIINYAYDTYRPEAGIYALVSGGSDSLTALKMAMQHPAFKGAVTFDTGTGLPTQLDYVKYMLGEVLQVPYYVYKTTERYEDLILNAKEEVTRGMPGPALHFKYQTRLKDRARSAFERDHKPRGEKILYVTGIRKSESLVRMGYKSPIQVSRRKNGQLRKQIWCNPIFYWREPDKNLLFDAMGWKRNPVSVHLGISGDCLCGCFGSQHEKKQIKAFNKERGLWIEENEVVCREKGYWHKYGGPPRDWRGTPEGQLRLQKIRSIREKAEPSASPQLCSNCVRKQVASQQIANLQ